MANAVTEASNDIFNKNPYESHPSLSQIEANVLWEYAKLAQHIKDLVAITRQLGEEKGQILLGKLRVLEKKMGLVLTLYKASVWAVINERPTVENSGLDDEASLDRTIQQ